MMTTIIIVGAGPAGSTCAAELAEHGLRVKLIDKTKDFNDRSCGGAIGPKVFDYNVGIPQIKSLRSLRGTYVFAPNGNMAMLDCSTLNMDRAGYIFDRSEFDIALAKKAERKGAELILNERVKNVYHPNRHFEVITDKRCYNADIVIDASGWSAKIAKKYGIVRDLKPLEYRFTVQAVIENSDFLPRKDYVNIYLDDAYASKSYAWVFPDGNDRIKVGLGVPKGINANKCLQQFIADKQIEGRIIERRGKFVPVTKPPGTLVSGYNSNVLALGDAGRLCDALTGGGILPAMISGKCAGRAVCEGKTRRYDWYRKPLHRDLMRRWVFSKLIPLNNSAYDIMVEVLNTTNFKPTNVNRELARAMVRFLWLKGKDNVKNAFE